jgi:hypothetical protein
MKRSTDARSSVKHPASAPPARSQNIYGPVLLPATKPKNATFSDIRKAVRATLKERAAKKAK